MLSLGGIPLLGTLDRPRITVWDISTGLESLRAAHAVPDSGDLGRLSNPRRARLRTPDQ